MIEALNAFSTFAGACLVLASACLLFLAAVCWGRDIWQDAAERRVVRIIPRTMRGIFTVGILGGLLVGFAAGGLTTQYMECSGSARCNYANR